MTKTKFKRFYKGIPVNKFTKKELEDEVLLLNHMNKNILRKYIYGKG